MRLEYDAYTPMALKVMKVSILTSGFVLPMLFVAANGGLGYGGVLAPRALNKRTSDLGSDFIATKGQRFSLT